MASIYKRKDKKGRTIGWRAVVRKEGYPTICKQFDRQEEAEDWATEREREIKQGRFNVNLYKSQHTFTELLARYHNDGALEHIRSRDDVIRHLEYWKSRLGDFALVHLTTDLLGKERRLFADTPINTEAK